MTTMKQFNICSFEKIVELAGRSADLANNDLKPSNVLLDEDMVAHLSDFGISKLLEDEVSKKCDLYNSGIMWLETFTRRKPNEFEGDVTLKQWASYSLPEAVMDVVDANLLTSTGNHL
ncbi:putative LRR receptor-like serine/threonine-protein kinase GSO1-like [Capsicum annuum]|nr:putative LRR receptor-like serine/threonine-protein kinase GSO1-like [Capsicum annuum]